MIATLMPVALMVVALSGALGCQSKETKACHASMTSAQTIVTAVDSKDLTSLETSLVAVDGAFALCEKAGRHGERDELLKAKNQLVGQIAYLKKKASLPKQKRRTPEELAELALHGDPDCPKGQAYRPPELKKEIRCTGVQPVDLPWTRAEAYYTGRGYKKTLTESPPSLRFEYGAELFVFTYAAREDPGPPRCLTVYPPPGMSWQEATSRVTGVSPQRLEKADTVKTDRGVLPLHVESSEAKVIVRIGQCG